MTFCFFDASRYNLSVHVNSRCNVYKGFFFFSLLLSICKADLLLTHAAFIAYGFVLMAFRRFQLQFCLVNKSMPLVHMKSAMFLSSVD